MSPPTSNSSPQSLIFGGLASCLTLLYMLGLMAGVLKYTGKLLGRGKKS